uniref:Uncharacterized protein n=1 Tax=Megaviridae environmental sample TaxID=1737588 RepID=A0A5J6VIQ8_9VIRU|nr:MAG: hypothetical protein [Megaviridae environmental sample]
MKFDHILYHRNCPDGFSALSLLMRSDIIVPGSFYWGDSPDTKIIPRHINNKTIIAVDLGYSKDIIMGILKVCKKLVFIDHHITHHKSRSLIKDDKFTYIYNEKLCGATLVFNYLNRFNTDKIKKKTPLYLKYIQDNDLGIWQYPETKMFLVALEIKILHNPKYNTRKRLSKWNILYIDDNVKRYIKKGKIYLEYRYFLLERNSMHYKLVTIKHANRKYLFVTVNNSGALSGKLGCYLNDKFPETDGSIVYQYLDGRRVRCILRSNDIAINWLAERYGGGGHPKAAAFDITIKTFDWLDKL